MRAMVMGDSYSNRNIKALNGSSGVGTKDKWKNLVHPAYYMA